MNNVIITGLRNIVVHNYQTLNLDIVKHVVENKLGEFTDFIEEMKRLGGFRSVYYYRTGA